MILFMILRRFCKESHRVACDWKTLQQSLRVTRNYEDRSHVLGLETPYLFHGGTEARSEI